MKNRIPLIHRLQSIRYFRLLLGVCLAVLPLLGEGCGDQPADPQGVAPTFSSIYTNILSKNCTTSSCHSALGQRAGLILEGDAAYDHLVGVRPTTQAALNRGFCLVLPGKVDSSFLLIKLTTPAADEGERMPSGNQSLSAQELDAIRTWIANGARRD